MSGWLLLIASLWGSNCSAAPTIDLAALDESLDPTVQVLVGTAGDDRPPVCVGDAPTPAERWPAAGRFWAPLFLDAGGAPDLDVVLAVRALGAERVCVYWPTAGRYRIRCQGPSDGLGLTLRYPIDAATEGGRPTWIRVDGALFHPPVLRVGDRVQIARHERIAELSYGVYYGLLFAIALVSLIGFYAQRLASYAWFSAFLVVFSAVVAGFTGRGLTLAAGFPGWMSTVPMLGVLAALFLLVGFIRAYLRAELKRTDPWRSLTALLMIGCLLGVAPIVVLGEAALGVLTVFATSTVVVLQIFLARRAIAGSTRARYLSLSLALLGLGMLLGAAHVLTGAYDGIALAISMVLGGALGMPFVLVLGVYGRIVRTTRERDQARGELVATQRLALLRALYCRITGLPRRQKLSEMFDNLADRLSRKGDLPIALYLVQIDNLSAIRQHHGREALEAVMIELSGRLRDGLDERQIVGRLDDWDLALIIPVDVPAAEVHGRVLAAAESMLRCTESPISWRGEPVSPSVSIGVALWPRHGESFGDLMRRCDSALFDAQSEGGNRIRVYSERSYLQRADRWARLQELGEALRDGDLEMRYQPIHAAADGRLLGVEALVRWRRPDGSIMLPGEFVPLAEESDLILDLGYWTATTAIDDLAWLEAQGIGDAFLSLNVSPRQLIGDVFVTQVAALLDRAGIAPSRLHIEITENRLVEGLERTRRLLARMGRSGLRVYVDDFGVGYSSLSYLRELPIHGLKIDRSFVENIGRTDQDETVLATVLRLAQGLGLDIIAEGVETEHQRAFLVDRGCGALQGHLFAEPLERNALLAYVLGVSGSVARAG